jgi:hypothetical protein
MKEVFVRFTQYNMRKYIAELSQPNGYNMPRVTATKHHPSWWYIFASVISRAPGPQKVQTRYPPQNAVPRLKSLASVP